MKIIHRVSVSSSDSARTELANIGIAVRASGHLMTFEVAESDELWPRVQRWIAATKALDIVSTRFSRQEIAGAEWLLLEPTMDIPSRTRTTLDILRQPLTSPTTARSAASVAGSARRSK
jgi:hypothetical protein